MKKFMRGQNMEHICLPAASSEDLCTASFMKSVSGKAFGF
jgi:hypothetical protein